MSNLIKCKDCGGTLSKRAKACPHCGADRTGGVFVKFVGFCVIVVIIILAWPFLIVALNGFLAGFHGAH